MAEKPWLRGAVARKWSEFFPGYTTDSVFYYNAWNNVAFVGDSIFRNSLGLTHISPAAISRL